MLKKSKVIQTFLDDVSKDYFGRTIEEAKKQKVCTFCGCPITDFRDELSRREYEISGSCQKCQDELFSGGDDE